MCFAAILWGALAGGGFFRLDLLIILALAVATVVTIAAPRRVLSHNRWLAWCGGSIAIAVIGSAAFNHQLTSAWYPLASTATAVALGLVGASAVGTATALILRRVIVDVCVLTALAGWFGVALHLPAFAGIYTEGWRAETSIGYVNASAAFMLVGLLCAGLAAAESRALSDAYRCWILLLGILATQSRGTALALVVCILVLGSARRGIAKLLIQTLAGGLVAFIGLLPSIHQHAPAPLSALLGFAGGALIILLVARLKSSASRWTLVGVVGGTSAAVVGMELRNRIVDPGSNAGHGRLWAAAVDSIRSGGFYGQGPKQLADFSNGAVFQLFAHNDLLQYLQYYGWVGAAALVVITWQIAMLLAKSRGRVDSGEWSLALAIVAALMIIALVDFPLQVPLIPAAASLVLGTAVGYGPDRSHSFPLAVDRHLPPSI